MSRTFKPFVNILKAEAIFLMYVPNYKESVKTKTYIFITMSFIFRIVSIAICIIPSIFHLDFVKKAKLEFDLSENYTVIFGGTSFVLVSFIFPFFSRQWDSLLKEVTRYNMFGKPRNVLEMEKFCYKSYIILKWYLVVAPSLYALSALHKAWKCLNLKSKLNPKYPNWICITVLPAWLPIEVSVQMEWIVFITQFFCMTACIIPDALICFLVWETSNMLTLHYEHLKFTIKNIVDEKNYTKRENSLKLWIKYHLQILKISDEFSYLTKNCMGIYTLIGSLIMAFVMNQIFNNNNTMGALLHVFGWMITLWLLSDAGQKIQEGTFSIGEAVYNSNWYNADVDTQKKLLFILQRCQKPSFLRALPLGRVNYELMLMIIKTAYSFLTLLTNTNKKTLH